MEENSYKALLSAIDNPEQTISETPHTEINKIIEQIAESKKAIFIKDIENELVPSLCACINSGYGHIILGVNGANFNLLGETIIKDDFTSLLKKSFKSLQVISGQVKTKLVHQKLGNGKSVYIYTVNCNSMNLCCVKDTDDVYLIDKNSSLKKANVYDIENLVRTKILSELSNSESTINYQIELIKDKLLQIKNPVKKAEIMFNIEQNSIPIEVLADVSHYGRNKFHIENDDLEKDNPNGIANGNVYLCQSAAPRLDESYLRYTCMCMANISEHEAENRKLLKINGPAIIISDKGGCYLVDDDEWYLHAQSSVLVVKLKQEHSEEKYIALAWLKSNIALGYCIWKNRTGNFYKPDCFWSITLPKISDETKSEIEELIKKLIEMEKTFLEQYFNVIDIDALSDDETDNISNKVLEFNTSVIEILKNIDCKFSQSIGLTEDQLGIINEDVEKEYFNYWSSKSACDSLLPAHVI